MRGESAFSVRADDGRRPRYGPPDGAIDYLALFLNAFSVPKQPRQLGGSKRLSAGSTIEQPRDSECARPHRAAHVAHSSRRVDRIGHDFRSWHETDMPTALRDVRSQGQSGKHLLALSFSGFDPEADPPLLQHRARRFNRSSRADSCESCEPFVTGIVSATELRRAR